MKNPPAVITPEYMKTPLVFALILLTALVLAGCASVSHPSGPADSLTSMTGDSGQIPEEQSALDEATPTPAAIKKKPTPTPEEELSDEAEAAQDSPAEEAVPTPRKIAKATVKPNPTPTPEPELTPEQLALVKECIDGSKDMVGKLRTDLIPMGASLVQLRSLLAKGYEQENAGIKAISELAPQAEQQLNSPSSLKETYGKLLEEYTSLVSTKTFGNHFKNLYNVLGKGTVRTCKPI